MSTLITKQDGALVSSKTFALNTPSWKTRCSKHGKENEGGGIGLDMIQGLYTEQVKFATYLEKIFSFE